MTRLFYFCLAVFAVAAPGAAQTQAAPAQVRHVTATDKRIRALTKPGEAALVIESRRSRPLEVRAPEGTSTVDWMFRVSDVVLLIVADDVRSQLTRNEDWITSTVEASILEVLKTPDALPQQRGDRVLFEADGGQLIVDGVLVTATVPWAKQVEALKRYFLLAGINKDTKTLVVGPAGLYEIADSLRQRAARAR
jgi:hypothetical protein